MIAAVAAAACLMGSTAAMAGDDGKAGAEVMALARAQWAAEIQGKSSADQMASAADDYTEFNQDFPVRIEGKALANGLSDAMLKDGSRVLYADMLNPKVQVYGDVAILSYNYVGVTQDKDGKTHASAAKSTRVYAKTGGQWKLVHANFAPAAAPQP
jgi:ketosteroid isomerase-like protein